MQAWWVCGSINHVLIHLLKGGLLDTAKRCVCMCTLTSLPTNRISFLSPRVFQATLELKGLLELREEEVKQDLLDPKESL